MKGGENKWLMKIKVQLARTRVLLVLTGLAKATPSFFPGARLLCMALAKEIICSY